MRVSKDGRPWLRSRLLCFALACFFSPARPDAGWTLYGGGGLSHSLVKGSHEAPEGFVAESGAQYEWGRLYRLSVHSGFSLGIYRLNWEGLQALNRWTLYTAGLHVGASVPLFRHPRFAFHAGGNLHSKWIPLFFMEDDEQRFWVEKSNGGGLTELEGYLRQDLGAVSLKVFYNHTLQPLLSQGGFPVLSFGLAMAWPLTGNNP